MDAVDQQGHGLAVFLDFGPLHDLGQGLAGSGAGFHAQLFNPGLGLFLFALLVALLGRHRHTAPPSIRWAVG
ncbi:hypothetical protein D3C79_1057270 [compost metagenome]